MSHTSTNNKEKTLDALDTMVEAERAVAEYYRACSKAFPNNRKFWQELSKQETSHADIIAQMSRLVTKQGHTYSIGNPAPVVALKGFINKIHSDLNKVKGGQISETNALNIAYHIESTFVEQKFNKVIRTDSDEFKVVLDDIAVLEEKHKKLVHDKLKQMGKK
jgi:rubrerythrin